MNHARVLGRAIRCGIMSISLGLVLSITAGLNAQVPARSPNWLPADAHYSQPFFENVTYQPSIRPARELLGYELGRRPVSHGEIERCLQEWAGSSPRMKLHAYGSTHEQRTLYYAVITSEENHDRIERIRSAIGKLADPRRLVSQAEADRIIAETPAIAWLAYCIHGDELSGSDAALAVIYHLIAGTGEDVHQLLDETVILIDPLQNPDGRQRWLNQLNEVGGYMPNFDPAAWQHGGRWPPGRGNHYCFDLNRDWILGTQPETLGRRRAILAWNPQLLVDGHEMWENDTYLFTPPREPINPHVSPTITQWWQTFADEQARAFDRFGWSYYTREWLEFWYPGYTDTWAANLGAIGILHEQARTAGHPIRQPSGRLLTFPEAVHHQIVSTMTNLETLRAHRTAILTDFLEQKRTTLVGADTPPGRTFLLVPSGNRTREKVFLDNLYEQGIEIGVFQKRRAEVENVTSLLGEKNAKQDIGAGTYVISRQQPAGPLLAAVCGFDPHLSDEFLQIERAELERHGKSKLYDTSAWSLPLAYGLKAYWTTSDVDVITQPYEPKPLRPGWLQEIDHPYGYVIDNTDDLSQRALAYLLQSGVKVRVAEKAFLTAGHKFPPGSLLIRSHENSDNLVEILEQTVASTGMRIYATETAHSREGPDLGGQHFKLLSPPRVALFGNTPFCPDSWGEIWHLFDCEIGLPISLLDIQRASALDLRRYNVIILPNMSREGHSKLDPLLAKLRAWVRNGGTLIAIGEAAAWLANEKSELSSVRLRSQVLTQLSEYEHAAYRELARNQISIDPALVWDKTQERLINLPSPATQPSERITTLDQWRQRFSPTGAIVRGVGDPEHWLMFSFPEEFPLYVAGSRVLVSKPPVQTPLRFAAAERLRLSGLLWPEAAARMGKSVYLTSERIGHGQVILFAQEPNYRGYWRGTRRLLINAVLLGPGCGTSPPPP